MVDIMRIRVLALKPKRAVPDHITVSLAGVGACGAQIRNALPPGNGSDPIPGLEGDRLRSPTMDATPPRSDKAYHRIPK
jgi:hypothetical protein